MKKNSLKKVASVGVGAIVGAGLGVLLAPKSGKETRKELADKVHNLLDKVKDLDKDDVKKEFKSKIEEIELDIKNLDNEKVLSIAKDKADLVINKVNNLVEMAQEKGNAKIEKCADELRVKAIDVTKKVLNKLEDK